MYKVFIENRPIIFTKKNKLKVKSHSINADLIDSIQKDLIPIIHSIKDKSPIYILCDNLDEDIDRLFEPFIKITTAGGIVRRKNHFLFIKRFGFWDLPKGKIEKKESIEEAAIREIEEECGIKNPEIIDSICVTYHTYEEKGKLFLKKTYWFSLIYEGKKELRPQTEEGITKVKWFKQEDLHKVKKNTYTAILDVLDLYFHTLNLA